MLKRIEEALAHYKSSLERTDRMVERIKNKYKHDMPANVFTQLIALEEQRRLLINFIEELKYIKE